MPTLPFSNIFPFTEIYKVVEVESTLWWQVEWKQVYRVAAEWTIVSCNDVFVWIVSQANIKVISSALSNILYKENSCKTPSICRSCGNRQTSYSLLVVACSKHESHSIGALPVIVIGEWTWQKHQRMRKQCTFSKFALLVLPCLFYYFIAFWRPRELTVASTTSVTDKTQLVILHILPLCSNNFTQKKNCQTSQWG